MSRISYVAPKPNVIKQSAESILLDLIVGKKYTV